ncbi:hypothetical protein [Pseudomonas cichorii]|uniref:hypothetical protein n=1 Tax=Pseudomonas cichorii TaxID=36746 RepID=UPI001C8A3438|nr:hypothetical protein [Pseudomonas cichorii]MBX8495373.1 hypothetical protein [Pseudomonas cichorii]MBX8532903.1 hypothetical protein [Pseudomonas cichorii]
MQAEWRKLWQLDAAFRLRTMQREKAELAYTRCCSELARAECLLSEEKFHYNSVQARFEELGQIGVTLDPALHEQRLLAQNAAYQRLESAHQPVTDALRQLYLAKTQLLKCRKNEDLIGKAKHQLRLRLDKAMRNVEAVDIFDAQIAQGAWYGY